MNRITAIGLALVAASSAVPASARTVLTFNNPAGWHPGDRAEAKCAEGVCVSIAVRRSTITGMMHVYARYDNDSGQAVSVDSRLSESYPNTTLFNKRIPARGSESWDEQMQDGANFIYVLLE